MTCRDCKYYKRDFKEKGYLTTGNRSGIICSKFGMLDKEINGQKTTEYVCEFFEVKEGK